MVGVTILGQNIPFLLIVALIALAVMFLILNRNDGLGLAGSRRREVEPHGPANECPRCGFEFRIEQREHLESGEVHSAYDFSCPKCGYLLKPNERSLI